MFLTSCVVGRANHWSALIGASHSRSYVLWEYGGYASEGVRQVAEFGSPIKMEEEIRQKVGLPSYGFSVGSFLKCECYFHIFSYDPFPSCWIKSSSGTTHQKYK